MPLSERDLDSRIVKILSRNSISTLRDLLQFNIREIRELPGIGNKAIIAIKKLVADEGLDFPEDPYGPYDCFRHSTERWDSKSRLFFLCPDCLVKFKNALSEKEPIYTMNPIKGTCNHCNIHFPRVKPTWWILCDVCNRVANSIGRGNESEKFAKNVVERLLSQEEIKYRLGISNVSFELLELPELLPISTGDSDETYNPDIMVKFDNRIKYGIEIKTGQSSIGNTLIGPNMSQFQLDHQDISGILSGISTYRIPIFIMHVQCINRIDGPSNCHKAVDLWWTSMPRFEDNYITSRTRPRETKIAGYFNINAFSKMDTFIDYLLSEEFREWEQLCKNGEYSFEMEEST